MVDGDANHCPQHHELPLGKIDDAGHTVDDHKAQGNEGIYTPAPDAVNDQLDILLSPEMSTGTQKQNEGC